MIVTDKYTDLRGVTHSLSALDDEERSLVEALIERAASETDWNRYSNHWTRRVAEFYDARGLSRDESCRTTVYRIAQDLASRIGIAAGIVRPPDYRDELADLVRRRFRSQREFCQATGISEDMLSHVLARRKHLAIDTLNDALARIGYTVRIEPLAQLAEISER